MLDGPSVVAALKAAGATHVVWLPDSELGTWEAALTGPGGLPLIRVCREGEAVAVAAGLCRGAGATAGRRRPDRGVTHGDDAARGASGARPPPRRQGRHHDDDRGRRVADVVRHAARLRVYAVGDGPRSGPGAGPGAGLPR